VEVSKPVSLLSQQRSKKLWILAAVRAFNFRAAIGAKVDIAAHPTACL
jgi:hypothetical protein